jgi:hypothetical protein
MLLAKGVRERVHFIGVHEIAFLRRNDKKYFWHSQDKDNLVHFVEEPNFWA